MRGCAEILGAGGALFGFLVVAEVVAGGFVSWEVVGEGEGGEDLSLNCALNVRVQWGAGQGRIFCGVFSEGCELVDGETEEAGGGRSGSGRL